MRPRWRRYVAWPILLPLGLVVVSAWWLGERVDKWAGVRLFTGRGSWP